MVEKIVQSPLDLLVYRYTEFGRVFNHVHWFKEKYLETCTEIFCYNNQNIRVQLCSIVDL